MGFENFDYKAFAEITDALAKSCATADASIKDMAKAMKMCIDLTATSTHTHGFTIKEDHEAQRSIYENRRTHYKKKPEPKPKPKLEPEKPETFGMWS